MPPAIKHREPAYSTTDADQLRRWWRIRRGALAAIDLRKAGLVVIDADRHGGPDGVDAWDRLVSEHGADLSAHPIVATPSNGVHVYFAQPEGDPIGNRRGSLPPAVDVKGAGGCITAPGCIKPDGTFYESIGPDLATAYDLGAIRPMPGWLASIIRTAHRAAREAVQRVDDLPAYSGGSRFQRYAAAALAGQTATVAATTVGGRNNALNAAAFRLGQLAARQWLPASAIERELLAAAETNGLLAEDGEQSVMATIHSGLSAGLANPAADPRGRR
ncbi:MAG: bifunctional DNA primase/polymerase [Xanthobacteraceae bacterium]